MVVGVGLPIWAIRGGARSTTGEHVGLIYFAPLSEGTRVQCMEWMSLVD